MTTKRLQNLRDGIGGVQCDVMHGDNLAVTLCTHFCDGGDADDETCWSAAAITGCDQTLDAIHAFYAAEITKLCTERDAAKTALAALVNAKALNGVRAIVAGWNGEGRDEPFRERHPKGLGATLPKTNCGAVYDLDEAMQAGHAIIATDRVGE